MALNDPEVVEVAPAMFSIPTVCIPPVYTLAVPFHPLILTVTLY